MLGSYSPGGLGEVKRDAVVGLDHEEMGEAGCRRQSEDPVKNAADRCWSRHETMVRFSCTLTLVLVIVPSVLSPNDPVPGQYTSPRQRTRYAAMMIVAFVGA